MSRRNDTENDSASHEEESSSVSLKASTPEAVNISAGSEIESLASRNEDAGATPQLKIPNNSGAKEAGAPRDEN